MSFLIFNPSRNLAQDCINLRAEVAHYAQMAKETKEVSHATTYIKNQAHALRLLKEIHITLLKQAEAHCRQLVEQLGGASHSITEADYAEPLLLKKFKMAVRVFVMNAAQCDKLYKTRMLKTHDNPVTEMRHHLGRWLIQAKRAGWAM